MAFKFFVLAAFVGVFAISASAQTTGSSSGGSGGLLAILRDPLGRIVDNLVEIIEKVGDVLNGTDSVPGGIDAILDYVIATVCQLLQVVGGLLQSIAGDFKLDQQKAALDSCSRLVDGAVSGQAGASTASGPIGGI